MNELWIFTFGSGQPNAGHYVRLHGTYEEARKKMTVLFENNWAMQYSFQDWHEWTEKAYAEGIPVETEMILTNFQRAKLAMHAGEKTFSKWLCDSAEEAWIASHPDDEEDCSCENCAFSEMCVHGRSGAEEWLSRASDKNIYYWRDY